MDFLPAVTALIGSFLGAYLTPYLRKKGENLATHEDIDKLVDQVQAVTSATKKIEAEISNDSWDRQRKWELKKEVLFKAVKRIAEIDAALLGLDAVVQLQLKGEEMMEEYHARVQRYHKAELFLDESALFVAIVCTPPTKDAFQNLSRLTNRIAAEINRSNGSIYANSRKELAVALFATRAAIQGELGTAVDGKNS